MTEIGEFEKELQALLKKHKKILFAAPTYVLKDSKWELSADLRWGDLPKGVETPYVEKN